MNGAVPWCRSHCEGFSDSTPPDTAFCIRGGGVWQTTSCGLAVSSKEVEKTEDSSHGAIVILRIAVRAKLPPAALSRLTRSRQT